MSNPIKGSQAQIIGAIVMIILAIILGLTHYKLPGFTNTKLPTLTKANNSNQQLTNTTMSQYTFPGQLPADQIENKSVHLATSRGQVVIALDPVQAPLAASNFVYLINQKFYDGIIFHRVKPGFVVQAGDPQTKDTAVSRSLWGTGGPGYNFADETVTGEYTTGTLAMANAGPNTNGSQFFILLGDHPELPKKYTIFGHVTSGLDVVQQLQVGDTIVTATVAAAQ